MFQKSPFRFELFEFVSLWRWDTSRSFCLKFCLATLAPTAQDRAIGSSTNSDLLTPKRGRPEKGFPALNWPSHRHKTQLGPIPQSAKVLRADSRDCDEPRARRSRRNRRAERAAEESPQAPSCREPSRTCCEAARQNPRGQKRKEPQILHQPRGIP